MSIINLDNDPTNKIPELNSYQRAVYLSFRLDKPGALSPDLANREILAYINRGRWIVECPYCHSADLASKRDPRFWCAECGMIHNSCRGLRVIFPPEQALREIEAILSMRPNPVNRNWRPGELIAQLARENLDHGCISILEK